jgi:hypothetical protein
VLQLYDFGSSLPSWVALLIISVCDACLQLRIFKKNKKRKAQTKARAHKARYTSSFNSTPIGHSERKKNCTWNIPKFDECCEM